MNTPSVHLLCGSSIIFLAAVFFYSNYLCLYYPSLRCSHILQRAQVLNHRLCAQDSLYGWNTEKYLRLTACWAGEGKWEGSKTSWNEQASLEPWHRAEEPSFQAAQVLPWSVEATRLAKGKGHAGGRSLLLTDMQSGMWDASPALPLHHGVMVCTATYPLWTSVSSSVRWGGWNAWPQRANLPWALKLSDSSGWRTSAYSAAHAQMHHWVVELHWVAK